MHACYSGKVYTSISIMVSLKPGIVALLSVTVGMLILSLYLYGHSSVELQDTGKQCYWTEVSKPDSFLSPPIRPPAGSGTLYAAVLDFDGQQGSGTLVLSSFQCFLTKLHGNNALIAEPQFKDSGFNTYEDSYHLRFGSLLDFDYFNEQSRKVGLPEMISLVEFKKYSPRHAVYVHIRPYAKGSVQTMVWHGTDIG